MMQTENNQNIFNRSDALTLEEIQASTDLSGKIASASALKTVSNRNVDFFIMSIYGGTGTNSLKINSVNSRLPVYAFGTAGFGRVQIQNGEIIEQSGDVTFSLDGDVLTLSGLSWYASNLIIIHNRLFKSY